MPSSSLVEIEFEVGVEVEVEVEFRFNSLLSRMGGVEKLRLELASAKFS